MFFCKRLSQDGSALSDAEETTLETLAAILPEAEIARIRDLGLHEGVEVEDASGSRYHVHRG